MYLITDKLCERLCVCGLTQQVPFILLDGPGQVQRDVPQSDWLREVILYSCTAICNTYREETETGETSPVETHDIILTSAVVERNLEPNVIKFKVRKVIKTEQGARNEQDWLLSAYENRCVMEICVCVCVC